MNNKHEIEVINSINTVLVDNIGLRSINLYYIYMIKYYNYVMYINIISDNPKPSNKKSNDEIADLYGSDKIFDLFVENDEIFNLLDEEG